jgi:hypothetical protein
LLSAVLALAGSGEDLFGARRTALRGLNGRHAFAIKCDIDRINS